MNKANNIILFPKINNNIQSKGIDEAIEEIQDNMEQVKYYHIEESIGNILPLLLNQIDIAGFDVDSEDDNHRKAVAFLIESVRSLLCYSHDVYHPFQKISSEVFSIDKEDENQFEIVYDLNINLRENDSEDETSLETQELEKI